MALKIVVMAREQGTGNRFWATLLFVTYVVFFRSPTYQKLSKYNQFRRGNPPVVAPKTPVGTGALPLQTSNPNLLYSKYSGGSASCGHSPAEPGNEETVPCSLAITTIFNANLLTQLVQEIGNLFLIMNLRQRWSR